MIICLTYSISPRCYRKREFTTLKTAVLKKRKHNFMTEMLNDKVISDNKSLISRKFKDHRINFRSKLYSSERAQLSERLLAHLPANLGVDSG